jgi:phosphohistidine phosphatase
MKRLILIRHAEAAEPLGNQPDKERDLTSVGKNNATQIGGYLFREKFWPDIIISSDAKRARSTTQIIASQLKTNTSKVLFNSLLYTVSNPKVFLNQTNTIPDRFNTVVLVGHNPIFSSMAEYFTNASKGNLPPSAAIVIEFEVDSWKNVGAGTGNVAEYVYPAIL